MFDFLRSAKADSEDFEDYDERLLKVERRVKELELENGILRNKVLRKIQTRYTEEEPTPRRKRTRKLYGGRSRTEDYEDEEEDDY